ncbi:MAG TPA: DPP IV N-terminal domain-containing protein, partial [Sphingomicrobium sp.]|nr:DPP IV N-terminal domain-containing protein [Sphingomicrobium sp.]
LLVDSAKLVSMAVLSEAEKMRRERLRLGGLKGVLDYAWSPDGRAVVAPIEGDLFMAMRDGSVRRLTDTPETEMEARVSGAGRYISYVASQNLHVIDLRRGLNRAITGDGGGTVTWGTAEFVAQEEMGRHEGHWWAPDDSRIAIQRTDEAPVQVVTRTAIGAGQTRVFEQRYPSAGTPNADVQLWIMNPDGSKPVRVDLGPAQETYLARVNWAPDASALYVQRQDRLQTRLDMMRVDPNSGRAQVIFTELARAKSWVNLSDNLRVLRDGSIIWWSERDGHGHLYRWRAGHWTQLTRGPWQVMRLLGVDEVRGRLFFTGNRESPLEAQVYSLDFRSTTAEPTLLTERGWWNDAVMDEAASRLVVTRSNPDQPPQTYLAGANGRRIAWIEQNRLDPNHPYSPYLSSHRATQFGTLKAADGSTLHWEMITPPLEAGKKYPVFFQHYGGPTVQQVKLAWGGALRQYWVDRGWIFFQIDNRGSTNRGKDFEDQIWRALGGVEVEDQVAAARWLKTQPFVDGERIATYGWSYGGFMTLKMLQAAPGVFAAGVSGAPVTSWRHYDTHATERYLGDPRQDVGPYLRTDPIHHVSSIRDPLLLIHGMADDNVVLDHSTSLVAKLQEENVPFELMLYPGMTHRITGAAQQSHMWRTIEDFLTEEVLSANSSTRAEQ